jgi:probable F420-dependent oxidoreductase
VTPERSRELQLGIWLPVHHLTPPLDSPWEQTGTVEDVALVVTAAEESGLDFVCCAEHVALPVSREHERGSRYWDPAASLGYVAALTTRLSVVPFVIVLGYHHPLAIAKRYGTLDLLSGGRMILGVGVGSLVEEFALLGASFSDRGARADDALAALRAARGARMPEHHGPYYDYEGMIVEPGLRDATPLWIGGRSTASARRAARSGDAWAPFGIDIQQTRDLLDAPTVRTALDERASPLDVILSNVRLDPLGDHNGTLRVLDELRVAGVTGIVPRISSTSPRHLAEQHGALVDAAGR